MVEGSARAVRGTRRSHRRAAACGDAAGPREISREPSRACFRVKFESRSDRARRLYMNNDLSKHSRGSAAGDIITAILLLGLIGLGAYLWLGKRSAQESTPGAASTQTAPATQEADGDAPTPIEPVDGTPA